MSLCHSSTETANHASQPDVVHADHSALKVGETALETLMRHALEVPGAAAALLDAFAAQACALRLVQEAEARGAASLPSDLRQGIAAAAARTPSWLAVGTAGVRV